MNNQKVIQMKLQEYSSAVKYIEEQRIELRNNSLPKFRIKKDNMLEPVYSKEFTDLDKKLQALQDHIWNTIFDKSYNINRLNI